MATETSLSRLNGKSASPSSPVIPAHGPTRQRQLMGMEARRASTNMGSEEEQEQGQEQDTETNRSRNSASLQTPAPRKVRKTPHSVIEKVRRARMNQEFDILQRKLPFSIKDAHKLEILQAAVEYIEELEKTVLTLQAGYKEAVEPHHPVRLPPLSHILDPSSAAPEVGPSLSPGSSHRH